MQPLILQIDDFFLNVAQIAFIQRSAQDQTITVVFTAGPQAALALTAGQGQRLIQWLKGSGLQVI